MSLRILLLLGLIGLRIQAQQSQPTVHTEFLTVALAEPIDGLFYTDGKMAKPFEANLTGLSQPVDYQGPQQLVLRSNAAEFTAKPPLPPPAASVLLPLNCSRVLLACVKSGADPLKIAAYDISTKDRAGDYRFFNFSTKPLSINFGDKRFALSPGKDTLISNTSWRDAVLDLPIQVANAEDGNPKLVYSSVWGHRPGRRNFIFMFDGRHPTKPVVFCRFFDIPPALKADP